MLESVCLQWQHVPAAMCGTAEKKCSSKGKTTWPISSGLSGWLPACTDSHIFWLSGTCSSQQHDQGSFCQFHIALSSFTTACPKQPHCFTPTLTWTFPHWTRLTPILTVGLKLRQPCLGLLSPGEDWDYHFQQLPIISVILRPAFFLCKVIWQKLAWVANSVCLSLCSKPISRGHARSHKKGKWDFLTALSTESWLGDKNVLVYSPDIQVRRASSRLLNNRHRFKW